MSLPAGLVERNGTAAPLWPLDVLEGPLPGDAAAREHYRLIRASVEPSYAKAFDRWLMKALQRKDHVVGYSILPNDEQKALMEGTDTSGGFVVPGQLADRIVSVVRERSVVRANAIVLPTSRDSLAIGVFDYLAEWIGEVPPTTDTANVAPTALGIAVRKARAKVAVSNDLLADQPAVVEWLTRTGGDQLSLLEDRAFVAGTGVGGQPLGMVYTAGSNTVDITGTTAHTVGNTTANLGSATGLLNLEANLPDAFRERAHWFCRGTILAKIRQLVDAQARYLFLSQEGRDGYDRLGAHPIHTSSAMPNDGVANARPVLIADLSQFVIATRALLTVRVARETLADTEQTLIYLFDRVGGAMAVPDALRIGTVT